VFPESALRLVAALLEEGDEGGELVGRACCPANDTPGMDGGGAGAIPACYTSCKRTVGEMIEHEHNTQTMTDSQARAEWSQVLDRVARKQARVLVKKDGVPVAAIVSADDLGLLAKLDADRRARFAEIEAIRAKNADKDPDAVEQDVAAEIAAMRAQRSGIL
jgi:prevent-host-death family protein